MTTSRLPLLPDEVILIIFEPSKKSTMLQYAHCVHVPDAGGKAWGHCTWALGLNSRMIF
jgi:hypothetical protein